LLLFLVGFLLHGLDGERSSHSLPSTGALYLSGMLLLPETKKGPAAPIKVKAIFATYKSILISKSFIIPNMVAAALIASVYAFIVSAAPIFVTGLQLSPALVGCFPAGAVSGTILGGYGLDGDG
jgi:DHA1 family bicyclomycin/chloramphenicol resistance-like MFS transporter